MNAKKNDMIVNPRKVNDATATAPKPTYVKDLADMIKWVKTHRDEYVTAVASSFMNSSKNAVSWTGNWTQNVDWSDDAEEERRRLMEIRIYDDAKITKAMIEKFMIDHIKWAVDSKAMEGTITNDIKCGNYHTATFRCGRVRIILVEIGG